ncbi:MAG: hypothetical protein OXC81_03240 [Betaproteobacteria bacterium]|nr:hypothetical protein [Betaproteobacteria bacterium]
MNKTAITSATAAASRLLPSLAGGGAFRLLVASLLAAAAIALPAAASEFTDRQRTVVIGKASIGAQVIVGTGAEQPLSEALQMAMDSSNISHVFVRADPDEPRLAVNYSGPVQGFASYLAGLLQGRYDIYLQASGGNEFVLSIVRSATQQVSRSAPAAE